MSQRPRQPIGYFDDFGGRYVPETLMSPVADLARAYDRLAGKRSFRKRLDFSDNIHFLPKPFSLQQLAGKVKEVMHVPET